MLSFYSGGLRDGVVRRRGERDNRGGALRRKSLSNLLIFVICLFHESREKETDPTWARHFFKAREGTRRLIDSERLPYGQICQIANIAGMTSEGLLPILIRCRSVRRRTREDLIYGGRSDRQLHGRDV